MSRRELARSWVVFSLTVAAGVAVAVAGLLFSPVALSAAPLPPDVVVNHETKECAEVSGGDECMACYAPEGWESLGDITEAQCPSGYTFTNDLDVECRPFKTEFCCSEGHSGVHGDCEDLVVYRRKRLCAFVEDIQTVSLPGGWRQRPSGRDPDRWFCPSGYEWVADLDADATAGGADSDPKSGDARCLGAALLGPVVVGVWFAKRGASPDPKGFRNP
jgi:hypothetical protein